MCRSAQACADRETLSEKQGRPGRNQSDEARVTGRSSLSRFFQTAHPEPDEICVVQKDARAQLCYSIGPSTLSL